MLDCRGNRLFEYDIVCVGGGLGEVGVIEYDEENAQFIVRLNGIIATFEELTTDEVELISNVFDDPEIVEGWWKR